MRSKRKYNYTRVRLNPQPRHYPKTTEAFLDPAATEPRQQHTEKVSLFDSLSAISNNRTILALVVAAVTLLLYIPVRHFLFVNYDDDAYLNYHVQRGLTWENVKWAFTTFHFANWHPVTWLAHMLDCQWFKLNPAGHHMTNLLLHCLNAAILFLLLDDLTGCKGRSFLVAMLFAIHPLNVQSVAWISEKKNLLSTLFLFLAIGAYTHYVRRPGLWRYLAVLVLFALGLMSKPMIVTFPFLLLLLDYWPLRRLPSKNEQAIQPPSYVEATIAGNARNSSLGMLLLEKLPFFMFSAADAFVTVVAQRSVGAITDAQFALPVRLENSLVSYVSYILKMLWPVRLAVYYPHPGNSISPWRAPLAFFFLLAVTAIVSWRKDKRYLPAGWLAYLGTLVPVIGLVQVGSQSMADRYAYVPLIGLFIIVVWGAGDLLAFIPAPAARSALAAVTLCLLVSLALDTRKQLGYWHDGVALFSRAAAVTGDNYTVYSKLAEALEARGRLDEALSEFQSYVVRHPDDASGNYNLAAALLRRGRTQEAIAGLEHTLTLTQVSSILAHTHYQLGNVFLDQGDTRSAESHYRKAIELDPREYGADMMLGLLLGHNGKEEEAILYLKKSAEMDKPDSAYFYLGQAYESEGRLSEALTAYEKALTVVPESEQIQRAIATVQQHQH